MDKYTISSLSSTEAFFLRFDVSESDLRSSAGATKGRGFHAMWLFRGDG